MKRLAKQKLRWLLYAATITNLSIGSAFAQKASEFRVDGLVVDAENQPLAGANVVLNQNDVAMSSDVAGKFVVAVRTGDKLTISLVGYLSKTVSVNNDTTLIIQLNTELNNLEEVVVTGYGSTSRRNVTGSISKINMSETETLPNTNVSQAIRGRVAGVQFVDNGRPGQGGSILIRGQRSITAGNDPLIVLDGIIFNGALANINPSDIASMEILKDASATAIYGSRAANGVVLITSKRGSSDRPTIAFNMFAGFSDWSHRLTLLTPERYITQLLDYRREIGLPANIEDVENYLSVPEAEQYRAGKTIDPWDIIAQDGGSQSYNINVSGQSGRTNYFMSGSLTREQGLVLGEKADRSAVRINIENDISNWLKIGVNTQFAVRDGSGVSANLGQAYFLSPYGKLYHDEEQERPVRNPSNDGISTHPLFAHMMNRNENILQNLFSNIFANIKIPFIEGLSYRLNYSPTFRSERRYNFSPIYREDGYTNLGSASKFNQGNFDWVLENILNYSREFGQSHQIDLTLMYGGNEWKMDNTTVNGSNIYNDATGWDRMQDFEQLTASSWAQVQAGISSMARINYGYRNRYLFTFTIRRDGSSVFGRNYKYGSFPSAALAWIVSDEAFLKSSNLIDFLKVRMSYGSVGNQAIDPYQSLGRSSTVRYVFGDGGPTSIGIYPSGLQNSELTWETTTTTNVGVDFTMLKGRLAGAIEAYNMDTKDLLLSRALPSPMGFSTIMANIGATNNKGIEVSLNSINVQSRNFQWNSDIVFSTNKNRIVHLYRSDLNGDGVEDDDLSNQWFIGKPIDVYFDYVFDGIYQEGDEMPSGEYPGSIRRRDVNGDGLINADDRSIIGQKQPKFRYGITNTFSYKNFSLSFFISAMHGWIQSADILRSRLGPNYTDRLVNMYDAGWWTPDNKSNSRPSLNTTNNLSFYTNRDFIRLQDVSFAYEFGNQLLDRLKFKKIRLYLSAKNLYTTTNYVGFDPEIGSANQSNLYPMARTFVFGANLNF